MFLLWLIEPNNTQLRIYIRAALQADDTAAETTGIVTRSKAKTAHAKDSTACLRQSGQPRQLPQPVTALQKIQSKNPGQAVENSTRAGAVPKEGIQTTLQPQSSKQTDFPTPKKPVRKDDTNKSKVFQIASSHYIQVD